MKRLALAAATAAIAATAWTPAQAASFDAEEKREIRAEVRAYLLENPEVLMEAMDILRARQQAEQERAAAEAVAGNLDALIEDPRDPVAGNPDGAVTIVEFFDYNCGYCKRAAPTVAELIERNPDVRIVYKEFPILSESSETAAKASLGVWRTAPEAYKAFQKGVYAMTGPKTRESLLMLADEVGADSGEVAVAMDSPAVAEQIADVRALASEIGVTGTPGFVIGSSVVPGAVPLKALEARVEAVRAQAD